MLHIVAYDIKEPKRMRKVALLCLDYGVRVQYSIFQFDLNEKLTAQFVSELKELIDPAADRLMIVPVCEKCRSSILCLGQMKPFELPLFFSY